MSTVDSAPVQRPQTVEVTAVSASAAGGAEAALDLLPAGCAGGLQGAIAMLYSLMAKLQDEQVANSKNRIDGAKIDRDVALKQEADARERARRAAEKGGFFDWVAKDVGIAGAAGLVTFNYALVVADVAAHKLDLIKNLKIDVVDVGAVATGRLDVVAADILLRKTDLTPTEARDILERVGIPKDAPGISDEDAKKVAKDLIQLNLLIASCTAAVLSCGTTSGLVLAAAGIGLSYGGMQVAEHGTFDKVLGEGSSRWIGLGMQIYGVAASVSAGFAGGGGALMKTAGAKAAGIINGASGVMRGTDQVVLAAHKSEGEHAEIDAERAHQKLARLEREIEMVLDQMHEVNQTHNKSRELVSEIVERLSASPMTANSVRA